MIFVGIDVAKDKHDCHILDSDGVVLCDIFSFSNSAEGFNELLQRLDSCGTPENTKVGLESTGHYSTNLLTFLKNHCFEVVVFNPLSVNRLRTASTLRKTKTDSNDARYLAGLLMSATHSPYHHQSYHISTLKALSRARFRLVKEIQPLKNRYRRLIHILFPELAGFFCKPDISAVLALLEALPSAKHIADCNILSLTKILSDNSHGRFKRTKADDLKALAKSSIATFNPGDAFELKLTVQRIRFLESQKSELENQITALMQALNSPITSIPGIGFILGAAILSEIGDIHAFSNPDKLLAFAGAEPSTYQSGKFTATRTPMVKRGSRYLRNALYLAVNAAYLHSPSFRHYVDRKRSQGKHFYIAMSHGMKKLVRVIFAVLSRNVPYLEPAI